MRLSSRAIEKLIDPMWEQVTEMVKTIRESEGFKKASVGEQIAFMSIMLEAVNPQDAFDKINDWVSRNR